MNNGTKLKVKQIRGTAGRDGRTKATLRALGLGRIGLEREHQANDSINGMIRRVQHLLEVSEVK